VLMRYSRGCGVLLLCSGSIQGILTGCLWGTLAVLKEQSHLTGTAATAAAMCASTPRLAAVKRAARCSAKSLPQALPQHASAQRTQLTSKQYSGHSRALKGYSGYSGYSDPTVASRADHGNAKQSRWYASGNPEYLVSTPSASRVP
jgi:hypothetical protein